MAKVLSSMIYVPNQGVLNVISPDRFRNVLSVHSIIDCSELFVETPQDHKFQVLTWSTYKHHNTLKFLIGVAPNSCIIFISKAFSGRISDKERTIDCGYLDEVMRFLHVPPSCVTKDLTSLTNVMLVILLCMFHLVSEEYPKWVMLKWQRQTELQSKES